jgi:hypothetical protein
MTGFEAFFLGNAKIQELIELLTRTHQCSSNPRTGAQTPRSRPFGCKKVPRWLNAFSRGPRLYLPKILFHPWVRRRDGIRRLLLWKCEKTKVVGFVPNSCSQRHSSGNTAPCVWFLEKLTYNFYGSPCPSRPLTWGSRSWSSEEQSTQAELPDRAPVPSSRTRHSSRAPRWSSPTRVPYRDPGRSSHAEHPS